MTTDTNPTPAVSPAAQSPMAGKLPWLANQVAFGYEGLTVRQHFAFELLKANVASGWEPRWKFADPDAIPPGQLRAHDIQAAIDTACELADALIARLQRDQVAHNAIVVAEQSAQFAAEDAARQQADQMPAPPAAGRDDEIPF